MDEWFKKTVCDRCGASLKEGYMMSRFNRDALCHRCLEEERKHPDYRKAVEAELAALRAGIRDFDGIGWPGKDGRVK